MNVSQINNYFIPSKPHKSHLVELLAAHTSDDIVLSYMGRHARVHQWCDNVFCTSNLLDQMIPVFTQHGQNYRQAEVCVGPANLYEKCES